MKFSEKNFLKNIKYKKVLNKEGVKKAQLYDINKRQAPRKIFMDNNVKGYKNYKHKKKIFEELPKDLAIKTIELVEEINAWSYTNQN